MSALAGTLIVHGGAAEPRSMYLSPLQRRLVLFRRTRAALLWVLAFALLSKLDGWVYTALRPVDDRARAALEIRDWWQFLRTIGYLPTWVFIGAALALAGAPDRSRATASSLVRAGLAVIASALVSGLVAEIVKRVVGRLRPGADGGYHFKPFLSAFADGANLGLPSSHAAVAFGGAFALCRLFPAPGWLAAVLAAGCGLSRLLSGAHFATDVLAAAAIGYASAAVFSGSRRPRAARFPL